MKDFTPQVFSLLLNTFQSGNYRIVPFCDFITKEDNLNRYLILRHDVDRYPLQALKLAHIEAKMGILSTYYFRTKPSVFKPEILKEIASLGHEIGYHYEDLSICHGDVTQAVASFIKNLDAIREFYPVKTMCMHGSPLSRWDNKSIWKDKEYKKYGILADANLDIDYKNIFYITDNGNGWNKTNVSIRDKVETSFHIPIQNTNHLISLIQKGQLPDRIMLNAHPNSFLDIGTRNILNQSYTRFKNSIKWFLVKYKEFR